MQVIRNLENSRENITDLMEMLDAEPILVDRDHIVIKPNLVTGAPPPVTTPVQLVEEIIIYIRDVSNAKITIAEGSGSPISSTMRIFKKLGYFDLANSYAVDLVDLNSAKLSQSYSSQCSLYPEFWLPTIVRDAYLISVPVLKAHQQTVVTLTMKNMIGCAPPKHYSGWAWKKSGLHKDIHRAVFEINCHRTPDLTILDASMGLAKAHLGGPLVDPPPDQWVGGYDPVQVDAYGASLLGIKWQDVPHIKMAHNILGYAEGGADVY